MYLHLLTKLNQLCHVVYHVQPIVTVGWDSVNCDLSYYIFCPIIYFVLDFDLPGVVVGVTGGWVDSVTVVGGMCVVVGVGGLNVVVVDGGNV